MARRQQPDQHICAVTGVEAPAHQLLKCVVSPEGFVVGDLKQSLPGQAIWLVPHHSVVHKAADMRVRRVKWPQALSSQIARQMRKAVIDHLSLARRSGGLVMGYENVHAALEGQQVALLLQAADAAEGGRAKLRRLAEAVQVAEYSVLDKAAFGQITGRENQSHLALKPGGLCENVAQAMKRWMNYEAASAEPLLNELKQNERDG